LLLILSICRAICDFETILRAKSGTARLRRIILFLQAKRLTKPSRIHITSNLGLYLTVVLEASNPGKNAVFFVENGLCEPRDFELTMFPLTMSGP
jgi:hypothetical protein